LRAGISGVQPKVLVLERQETGYHEDPETLTRIIKKCLVTNSRFGVINESPFVAVHCEGRPAFLFRCFTFPINAKLFVMRRFDRDDQSTPIGFEDMAVLMGLGLSAHQKYSKSYAATLSVCSSARLKHLRTSLDQLFDSAVSELYCRNGDAHLKTSDCLFRAYATRCTPGAGLRHRQQFTAYIPKKMFYFFDLRATSYRVCLAARTAGVCAIIL